jgi:hypothetical protein
MKKRMIYLGKKVQTKMIMRNRKVMIKFVVG